MTTKHIINKKHQKARLSIFTTALMAVFLTPVAFAEIDIGTGNADVGISQMNLTEKITNYVDSRFNGVYESIGAATYRSEYASALGLTWQVSNRTALKGMVSFDSQSGTGITAGLAVAF